MIKELTRHWLQTLANIYVLRINIKQEKLVFWSERYSTFPSVPKEYERYLDCTRRLCAVLFKSSYCSRCIIHGTAGMRFAGFMRVQVYILNTSRIFHEFVYVTDNECLFGIPVFSTIPRCSLQRMKQSVNVWNKLYYKLSLGILYNVELALRNV